MTMRNSGIFLTWCCVVSTGCTQEHKCVYYCINLVQELNLIPKYCSGLGMRLGKTAGMHTGTAHNITIYCKETNSIFP